RGRRGERGVPARADRGDPAAGRLGGRDHLQLRDQPVHRPARRLRRELPRTAARRPPGHLRHPRRGPPHPGRAARARRPGRLHRRGALLCRVPRRAGPGRVHEHHHHSGPAGRGRRALGDHPRAQAVAMPSPATGVRTEPMTDAHATDVLAIYQAGIEKGNATFETCVPDWAVFTAARLPAHRYVAITKGRVAGWVAASGVSGRCVYAGVVEHSVYVHPATRGHGVGYLLLDALIASTEAAGIWTIQSGIFPENTASLALHRAAGFRVVGTRERIGCHHGRWRDV